LRIRAVRRDPLLEPLEIKPSGLRPSDLERCVPGRDEYAELVSMRLSNVPGIVVAGVPGYGKSNVIAQFIVHFAPSEAFQLAIVDGKGGGDYEDAAVRCFAWAGDDLIEANRIFQRVYELRRRRSDCITSLLGVKNMWHLGPSAAWPLVVLIIDEAHTFLYEP